MNIIFTTLSIKSKNKTINYYRFGDRYCTGIQQQEPGTKYLLSYCKIDKIVVLGSEQTIGNEIFRNSCLSDWKDRYKCENDDDYSKLSTLDLFLGRIAKYYYENENEDKIIIEENEYQVMRPKKKNDRIEVCIVKETDATGKYNIIQLINALRGTKDESNNIYMDMQGGQRTSIFINNALLQLIGKQNSVYLTNLKKVVATNFQPGKPINEIVDETDRYRIVDLVSGMNAFLKYGKAGALTEYIGSLKIKSDNVTNLVSAMQKVDDAITMSRYSSDDEVNNKADLKSSITELRNAVNKFDLCDGIDDSVSNIISILIDGIKEDLGDLLAETGENEVDALSLAEWCVKNENYFSATTVIEAYFPSYFVKHGLLYYAKSEKELIKSKNVFEFYKACCKAKEKYLFNDINHYFIKNYLKICKIFLVNKDDKEPNYKNINYLKKLIADNDNPNLPIGIYSNDEEKLNLLVDYEFISLNRNSLAHANNESGISPEEIKERVIDCISKAKDLRNKTNTFHLSDEIIKNKEFDDNKKDEIWKQEILREINTGVGKYGITTNYCEIKDNRGNFKYKELYALSGLIPSFSEHKKLNKLSKINIKNYVDFFKKNKTFSEMLIDYYNRSNNVELEYDKLVKSVFNEKPQYDEKKTITQIKNTLNSYNDFKNLCNYLESEENWNDFVKLKMNEFQTKANVNGYDDETLALINQASNLFDFYREDNNIRNMIKKLIETDEKETIKIIRDLYMQNAK